MAASIWFQRGYSHGWKFYAKDYRVFAGLARVVRTMNAAERADYDAGYKLGHAKVDGARLAALGYAE